MRTSYYNEAFEEIVHPKLVALNYIKSRHFIVDIASALPFDFIQSAEQNNYFQVIQFLKMTRLVRLGKLLKLLSSSESQKFDLRVDEIIRWAPPEKNRQSNNTWLPSNYRIITDSSQLSEDDLIIEFYRKKTISKTEIYAYTYYSTLMVILGGEVTPVSLTQGFVATCMVFVGQITIAMIFANMSVALHKAYRKKAYQNKIQSDFDHLMKKHNVPKAIQNKVSEYQDYCWRKNIMFDKDLVDFSDVSLTLRRELLVFIHQKIILNVPLFSELEQYEVLSIIQKLKTQVYMPGESIIKKEELVTDMYFIDEGIVEIEKFDIDRLGDMDKFMIKTGDHFGELAILTHWKSEISVNSVVFTIIQAFSRKGYESLKKQFPDIERRLKMGFKVYKSEDKQRQVDKLKYNDIFLGLTPGEIGELYVEYMHDQFVDPETIIISPKEPMNAIYFILKGQLSVFQEDHESDESVLVLGQQYFESTIDDQIYELTQNIQTQKVFDLINNKIVKIGTLKTGNTFGLCPLREGDIKMENEHLYIISDTSCQLGVLTLKILQQIKKYNPRVYKILEKNIKKLDNFVESDFKVIMETEEQINSKVSIESNQSKVFYNSIEKFQSRKHVLQKQLNCLSIDQKVSTTIQQMNQTIIQLEKFQSKFKKVRQPTDLGIPTRRDINDF